MKKIVYSFGVIGLLVSCGGSTEETTASENKDTVSQEPVVMEEPVTENSFVLESGAVGAFKIGEPLSALPDALKNRKATIMVMEDGEEVEHDQHIIFNSLEDVVELVMEKNDAKAEEDLNIQEMKVVSNYYETADGIKVGATVSELVVVYPDIKLYYLGARGEIIGETSAYTGVQFVIDPSGCTKKVSGKKDISLSESNFKDDAKIQYIRVY
ncbi:MAG: hypothetical protein HYZ14_18385 [Bacteroidetes bacterium]|nr:hypothetical protein [Bacteroidota bacterium]